MDNKIKNVFFRTEANIKIGQGHLVRCEIIADNIVRDYSANIYFIYLSMPMFYQEKLKKKGYRLIKLNKSGTEEYNTYCKNLKDIKNSALIIDSDEPHFYTKEYQQNIKKFIKKLVIITFYNSSHFYSDIIHNQNLLANTLEYRCEPYTLKLLGPEYLILNDNFRNLAIKREKISRIEKPLNVLITFGGSDEPNRTETVLKAILCSNLKVNKISVVLGSMYKYQETLEKIIVGSKIKIEIYRNTPKMADLMKECNLALSSGGLTTWELGALGKLNILIPFSEREKRSALYLEQNNYSYSINLDSYRDENELGNAIASILDKNYILRIKKLKDILNVDGVQKLVEAIMN